MKFKVTKDNRIEIKKAIKGLPMADVLGRYENVVVMGSRLIEEGYKTNSEGQELSPDKKYVHTRLEPIDHQKRAENEYRQGGVPALLAYVTAVLDKAKQDAKKNSDRDN